MIRDRYSKKTKGYGFVSFKDPKDFMNAMREMNGEFKVVTPPFHPCVMCSP